MNLLGREVKLTLNKSSDEPPSPVASITKTNPIPQTLGSVEEVDKVAAENKFDIEKLNQRLVQQAEAYEASLEEKRKEERALLKGDAR